MAKLVEGNIRVLRKHQQCGQLVLVYQYFDDIGKRAVASIVAMELSRRYPELDTLIPLIQEIRVFVTQTICENLAGRWGWE